MAALTITCFFFSSPPRAEASDDSVSVTQRLQFLEGLGRDGRPRTCGCCGAMSARMDGPSSVALTAKDELVGGPGSLWGLPRAPAVTPAREWHGRGLRALVRAELRAP